MSEHNNIVLRRIFEELFNEHRLELIPTVLSIDPSDRKLNIDGMSLCQFENGKVCAVWQHWDNLGFLKEMGAVSPEMSVASTVAKLSA